MILEDRFLNKLSATDTDCIEFRGAISETGYGFFWYKGRNHYAHRIAWLLVHGVLPDELVLHTCDNRCCVNIDHLFLGTHQDNTSDMINKGRKFIATGETNGATRITEETARAIKQDLIAGMRQCDIARKHTVTCGIVKHINIGRAWRWLDGTNDRQL